MDQLRPGGCRPRPRSRPRPRRRSRSTLDLSRVDVLLLLDVIEHLRGTRSASSTRSAANLDHRPRTLHPDHAQRGLRRPAADAALRPVQLRQGRHPRPDPHPPLHLPEPAATSSRTPGSGSAGPAASPRRSPRRWATTGWGAGLLPPQPGADPGEPAALLVPDLRRGRDHARRRLRPRRQPDRPRPPDAGRPGPRSPHGPDGAAPPARDAAADSGAGPDPPEGTRAMAPRAGHGPPRPGDPGQQRQRLPGGVALPGGSAAGHRARGAGQDPGRRWKRLGDVAPVLVLGVGLAVQFTQLATHPPGYYLHPFPASGSSSPWSRPRRWSAVAALASRPGARALPRAAAGRCSSPSPPGG